MRESPTESIAYALPAWATGPAEAAASSRGEIVIDTSLKGNHGGVPCAARTA
jgi:hypothetical protein